MCKRHFRLAHANIHRHFVFVSIIYQMIIPYLNVQNMLQDLANSIVLLQIIIMYMISSSVLRLLFHIFSLINFGHHFRIPLFPLLFLPCKLLVT